MIIPHIVPTLFVVFQILITVSANCPPVRPKKGMEIRCLFPDRNTNSLLDCDRELPLGAELQYRCQRLFTFDKVPQQSGHMTCGEHGQWMKLIEFKEFQCLPACGRPGNATFDTLSSFIEMENETGERIFPWHATIFKRFGTTNAFKYACGATLVNPENKGYFVLTAAHCVTKNPLTAEPGPSDNFRVVLGGVSTKFEDNVVGTSQVFSPNKIVIEREYDPHSLQSNIAMIELNGPVKISETVQPVCFPTRTIANSQVRPGSIGELPVVRNDQLAYQEILGLPISEQGECLRDCAREPTITEFCAIHNTGTRLSPLESGTGLVFNDGSQQPIFFLQGVLTKVAGEAEGCAAHDTFTSVSVFLDWVNKVHDELAESQKVTEVVTNPYQQPFQPTRAPPTNSIESSRPPPQVDHETSKAVIPSTNILNLGQNLHNYYRRLHQAPPVRINIKLSKEAQEWADYLLYENKWEFSQGKDYSENIFQYFGKISDSDVIRKAVDNWYNAINKFNWNYPEASTFSQVVWKNTTEIGLGIASKGTKSVVVANYWPKGNIYYDVVGDDKGKYFRENVLPRLSPPDTVSLV
ncbi:uncharacterized protein LOC110846841 isoform X2 [Folsomia candida]|uniref:uncharacterized protein LOC110846841 isoform X2 n=1 Tax=Folsomia candida TaxID=158441 RepID=UPI001604C1C5|nr:uncharacterized protein LOC110846841 isoform X2 [Folsomia candida]